ncbi:MAG: acetylxylan esterase [Victivallales bacterium]|nr:acetylxylan esterase [Victivallales bacterium]
MSKTLLKLSLLFGVVFALNAAEKKEDPELFYLWGKLNQKSPIYQADQEMVFTIKLFKEADNSPVEGYKISWTRTGDDKITQKGESISTQAGIRVSTSIAKPGFVRVLAYAYDKDGKRLKTKYRKKIRDAVFDGGACVDPDSLKGLPEPADFDQFWDKQKKRLADEPMKILEKKEVEGNDKVKAYDVKISCPGGMPVSGYLVMPIDAKAKSLRAEVTFRGYGVSGAIKKLRAGQNKIYLNINAHGIENGRPKAYYEKLHNGKLKRYCFDQKKNSNPETAYFLGMYLRVMRALEFVKSLPEWNGKDLRASGGSQGGQQSLAAAGLDQDVNDCNAKVPWCCDFGRTELGRIVRNWHVKYTPALNYFDPINLVKRANSKCKLTIVCNLGDYTCPPSGVWIVYNNFPGPKKMEVRQGCEHGYAMKNYAKFMFSAAAKTQGTD